MDEDDDGDGITNGGRIERGRTPLPSVITFSQMMATTMEMTFLMKRRMLTMTTMTTASTMRSTKMTTMTVSLMSVSSVVPRTQ